MGSPLTENLLGNGSSTPAHRSRPGFTGGFVRHFELGYLQRRFERPQRGAFFLSFGIDDTAFRVGDPHLIVERPPQQPRESKSVSSDGFVAEAVIDGRVTGCEDGSFSVVIEDPEADAGETEVVIPTDRADLSDNPPLRAGDRVTIGIPQDDRSAAALIRVHIRPAPGLSEHQIREGKVWASRIMEAFGWDGDATDDPEGSTDSSDPSSFAI